MLKGHVFSKQLFENPIFALFINTFLNGQNGVSDNYKNGMAVTYNGSTITIDSGAVCIQGRLLEEDTSTQVAAGSDTAYCKLVIEIDLDKQNTESDFQQASYKIVKSASGYPNLTQTNIVKNVAGIYQYELARFKTNINGISDFQDMRTFLNFDSIYNAIETEYRSVLTDLQQELASVEDGSAYILRGNFATITGTVQGVNLEENPNYTFNHTEFNYPVGFSQENCVVISVMLREQYGFKPYDWIHGDVAVTNGGCTYELFMKNDRIEIRIGYLTYDGDIDTTALNVDYKIVLMRIGE